jgi:hypothetical protein
MAEESGRTKLITSWQLEGKERERKELRTNYALQENNPSDPLFPMKLYLPPSFHHLPQRPANYESIIAL